MRQTTHLHIDQILAWADRHHELTGKWPQKISGRVLETLDEGWQAIDMALRVGCRGLPRGMSLARLLAERRGVRNIQGLPKYTIRQILQWADAHHARNGTWPILESGPIADSDGETWCAVGNALCHGKRGLRGGTSLARLLAQKRGALHRLQQPRYSVEQILVWADAHHDRTGNWPTNRSGRVRSAMAETWFKIDKALRNGSRGLPGSSSLARVLSETRGVSRYVRRPPLRPDEIVRWAEAHRARTGEWPTVTSGPIVESPDETWGRVHHALHNGHRGLPAGMTLARFLAVKLKVRNRALIPKLTEHQILAWADTFHSLRRRWPVKTSGKIVGAAGETWAAVDIALRRGTRGLRGGSSLSRLLAAKRGVPNQSALPRLSIRQIFAWADAYNGRMGKWPTVWSGRVGPYTKETWLKIDSALRRGHRGLPGGQSLSIILAERRRAFRSARG